MNGIALRILLGDQAKYIGLIFGIAFSTMLMSNQISIFVGLMLRTAGQILDAREADIWVMDPRVEYVDEIEPMTDMQLDRVRGVDGVDWAVPFFKGLTVAHTRDGMLQQIILLGVDDATLTGVAPRLVLGSVEDLKQPDAMIIDRAGFQFMWPGEEPGIGKVVELNDHRAVIIGISDASAPFTTYPIVYTKYSSARNYVGPHPQTDVHRIGTCAAGSGHASARPTDHYRDRTEGADLARVHSGHDRLLPQANRHSGKFRHHRSTWLHRRRRSGRPNLLHLRARESAPIRRTKAMGVPNGTILRMVLLQAMVVAGIGYAIGIGLCAGFFEITSRVSIDLRGFELPLEVAIGTACTVLVIIVIASFASLRKVMVVDPAIVFRG